MSEEQKKPYEEVRFCSFTPQNHKQPSFVPSLRFYVYNNYFFQIAKENKEKYLQEMEIYKQKKEEEAASLKKEEEEFMKIQKVEALQLLKKKEKTENIIKVVL